MKKLLLIICAVCALTAFCSCVETKTLTCDGCGEKVQVKADSNMEEDWIIYCKPCREALFEGDPLLGV